MKHMLCFDNSTHLRTVFDNLKAYDKLWFSLNLVCVIFSVHVQRNYFSRNVWLR